jgi:hypothetical protein
MRRVIMSAVLRHAPGSRDALGGKLGVGDCHVRND